MVAATGSGAFRIFHAVLGASLLAMGLMDLWHTLGQLGEPGHRHLALVAGLQTAGAVLLLIPRTVRWGGGRE